MYRVYYYLNGKQNSVDFIFTTVKGAIYKAHAIYTEHGINTDVMDLETGEIMAIFSNKECYLAPVNLKTCDSCPLCEI